MSWGGLTRRVSFAPWFASWTARSGLGRIRRAMRAHPRPWHLLYGLHQAQHFVNDGTVARLLTWGTSLFRLEPTFGTQKEMYGLCLEMARLAHSCHQFGERTELQLFMLFYHAKDITSAYEWYNTLAQPTDTRAMKLRRLTWLLRIAAVCPSQPLAEDMAIAVKQRYEESCAGGTDDEATAPTADGEQPLADAFREVMNQVFDEEIGTWIGEFIAKHAAQQKTMWRLSSVALFPQLERLEPLPVPMCGSKYIQLQNSLHGADYLRALAAAAEAGRPNEVIRLIRLCQTHMHKMFSATITSADRVTQEFDYWAFPRDPTFREFEVGMLHDRDSGPLPEDAYHVLASTKADAAKSFCSAEQYHYLILALLKSSPRLALDTHNTMVGKGLAVLDLTRAYLIARLTDLKEEQVRLLSLHNDEVRRRARIALEHKIPRLISAYWTYDYTSFFHEYNSMSMASMLGLVGDEIGLEATLQLVLSCGFVTADDEAGTPCAQVQELVVHSEEVQQAVVSHLLMQASLGPSGVHVALDLVTKLAPSLDLSLMHAIRCLEDYTLPAEDEICTSIDDLRRLVAGKHVALLDASFIESSREWSMVHEAIGHSGEGAGTPTLLLVPYAVVKQISHNTSIGVDWAESFDATLLASLPEEATLASSRLVDIAGILRRREARVLHFTEALMARGVVGYPAIHNFNDEFVAIAVLLRAVADPSARVVICSDDPFVHRRIEERDVADFAQSIHILRSLEPDQHTSVDATAKVSLVQGDLSDIAESMSHEAPTLKRVAVSSAHPTAAQTAAVTEGGTEAQSPWMAMLDDGDESAAMTQQRHIVLSNEDAVAAVSGSTNDEHFISPFAAISAEDSQLIAHRKSRRTFFNEFGAFDPDMLLEREMQKRTPHNTEETKSNVRVAQSVLGQEYLRNRGVSLRNRRQLAARFSSGLGTRVPFHLKYNVLEANVRDPRNKHLLDKYRSGVMAKRRAVHRHIQATSQAPS